jgi:hypothetical protein
MHEEFWCGNHFENEHLEDREGDGIIVIIKVLGRKIVRFGRGWKCLSIMLIIG